MIDNTHPRFNEPDYLGGFRITNEKNKVILSLRPECPKITWHHERRHLEDFLELGWKRYSKISKTTPWKHEESVWNYILKNRNKWSEPELVDAYLYYQDYVRRKTLSKIKIEIKEMEDLGKKLGLIK
ncbi:zincin-like metallopeptidase toxin domain-containing protein [Chryseobacterium lineare]